MKPSTDRVEGTLVNIQPPQMDPASRKALLDWYARPAEQLSSSALPVDADLLRDRLRTNPEIAVEEIFRSGNPSAAKLFVELYGNDPRWRGTTTALVRDMLTPRPTWLRPAPTNAEGRVKHMPARVFDDPSSSGRGETLSELRKILIDDEFGFK